MEKGSFEQISQKEAKEIIDNEKNYVILDVRTQEEYDAYHIDNAVVLPLHEIKDSAEEVLPDKNQVILIYCRSGYRSILAAEQLAELGYTNIKEFGGIIDWPYETVRDY